MLTEIHGAITLKKLFVDAADRIVGAQYHKIPVPGAHNHPLFAYDDRFGGLDMDAQIIDGRIVGVGYNSILVRTVHRQKVDNAIQFVQEWLLEKPKDGKGNWADLNEARLYTHPPDIQLFNDQPVYELLGDVHGKLIADIGCGNGFIALELASQRAMVDGIDVSRAMIKVASERAYKRVLLENTTFSVAASDNTRLHSGKYDALVCSLVINNISSVREVRRTFHEAYRILKQGGIFVVTLPHPLTLEFKTDNCWTEWENDQSQESLKPGEAFARVIKRADGGMIRIINNFWHPNWLDDFAVQSGFNIGESIELTATTKQISEHNLHEAYETVPFFLVKAFYVPVN